MRPTTVSLGLVGVGDDSFPRVMQGLARQRRLSLRDLFDPCLLLAEQRAAEHSAAYTASLRRLLRRVEGIVVLNPGWMGGELLLHAAWARCPSLVLGSTLTNLDESHWDQLASALQSAETLLMPQLKWRWARSVLRLRELTATRLGAVESLTLRAVEPQSEFSRLELIDLCQYVIQSGFRTAESSEQGDQLSMTFRRVNRDDTPVRATIELSPPMAGQADLAPRASVFCRHGRVELLDESSLEWSIGRPVEKESLKGERTDEELMFELFGRRLVGGVVPVPDLFDLMRARQVAAALATSRRSGRVVDVEPAR